MPKLLSAFILPTVKFILVDKLKACCANLSAESLLLLLYSKYRLLKIFTFSVSDCVLFNLLYNESTVLGCA